LKATSDVLNILRQTGNGISNWIIENIEFDGNNKADYVLYFQGDVQNLTLRNCKVYNSASGFVVFFDTVIGKNKFVTLHHNYFAFSSGGYDIVGSGGDYFDVIDNIFENNASRVAEGFAITNGDYIKVVGNKFLNFHGNAIHGEGNCSSWVVSNNYIEIAEGNSFDFSQTEGMTGEIKNLILHDNIVNATLSKVENEPSAGDMVVTHGSRITVSNNIFYKTSWEAINFGDVEDVTINGNVFVDCSWANVGVEVGDGSTYQRPTIAIYNRTDFITDKDNINIIGNTIKEKDESNVAGILVDTAYNANVHNNMFSGSLTYTLIHLGKRYINSGSATITSGSTSVTVNHGLAGTPTLVTVTPSADIGDVWVDSITSTQFTIHCDSAPSSDTTVYWYAEYKP